MRTSCYLFLIGALGFDTSYSNEDGMLCVLTFVGRAKLAWSWNKRWICAVFLFIVFMDGFSLCNCLALVASLCRAASDSEGFFSVTSFTKTYSRSLKCEY